MELPKELSARSSRPHRAVLGAGEEARAPPHYSSELAAPREDGWRATASGCSGEISGRAAQGKQPARSPQPSNLEGRDRKEKDTRSVRRRVPQEALDRAAPERELREKDTRCLPERR